MRSSQLTALAAASTAAALPEFAISKRDANLQTSNVARGLVKRAGGTVDTNVYDILAYSTGGAYYANVTVGTPPQDQVVILDTGSSDLYFDASTAESCTTPGPYTCKGGTFDHGKSSTYKIVDPSPAFNTSFGDGSTAIGPFAEDVVGIGDVLIDNVQFGVADEVNSTTGYAIGLMGIGYSLNEGSEHVYPNMPEVLRDAGVISSRLYSIFLNSLDAISGTLLFGGLDTSKYTGELVTLDLLPDPNAGIVYQFLTTVTALSARISGTEVPMFSGGSNSIDAYSLTDAAFPVLLDTGSSAWSIRTDDYNQYIAPNFPYIDEYGLCSCSHQNDDTSLTVEFGAALNITVPIANFVVPVYNATTNQAVPYSSAGDETCAFMLVPEDPNGSGFHTLGDAILRSMYLVFDLDNGQVSLAQAAVNSTAEPHIVTVSAGPSGVASAVGSGASYTSAPSQEYSIAPEVHNATGSFSVSTAQSTIGVATGTAAVPADAQVTETGTGTSSGGGAASSSHKGAAAGVVVPGVDFGVLGMLGVVGFMGVLGMGVIL